MKNIKLIGWLIKRQFKTLKEVMVVMMRGYVFKPTDAIVADYVLLLRMPSAEFTFDMIPPLFNLREAVAEALGAHPEE